MKRLIAIAALALAMPTQAQAQAQAAQTDAQAHDQLRAMKDRLVAALNAKNPDALMAELDPQVRLTTMDSVLSKGPEGVKGYYAKMMTGSSKLVEDMSLSAEPDDLSVLYSDGKTAITTGTAKVHFKLATGNEMDVPLRWTATSVYRDGAWKVASAQFGADMFDNPIVAAAKSMTTWFAAGAGLIGLLLGWFMGRRRTAA